MEYSTPLPLDPVKQPVKDNRRLWIGNLDSRVTEFVLLQLFKPFGKVTQFDFLIHKSGAQKGLPRGYAFITYETERMAEKAMKSLNSKLLADKRLSINYAHDMPDEPCTTNLLKKPNASSNKLANEKTKDVASQIQMIEAKLRSMDSGGDYELVAALTASTSKSAPVVSYSQNSNGSKQSGKISSQSSTYSRYRPYNRHRR